MDRLHALIVEDSPSMRQLLIFALSRIRGMHLVEAEDGLDALKKLTISEFDIIVVDINMPIMDGFKLLKRVRSDERYATIPIVVVTTEGGGDDRKKALALGANAFITKPIQSRQVVETVKALLDL